MTSTPTRPVDNVVIATKGLQDRNINILVGTTVENKGKLILNLIFLFILWTVYSMKFLFFKQLTVVLICPKQEHFWL